MSKINGIYAASMSVLNKDLTLNALKTLAHAEKLQAVVDAGEDYVLVVARKAESARGSA